ncbi:fimbrial protein [Photorhabdus luminescens]|uniref:Type 1 fimbrial protein n=1 Tax=Photorhabdus luminescens subsp. sonorensis TaxID=1173677 RepID=A0A5C4RN68_PHOLU|nr:fimbrial protein [Photorhabdus luminescens]TNH44967.1 type 1 fimbrial protein [Photorhabdus luminescens subsp. sonorensis]
MSLSVQADGKNVEITIKGNLLRPTCALSVNGKYGGNTDGSYNGVMPQVYASELRNSKYVERSALDLEFKLSHCSPGQSPALYIWSLDAGNSDDSELFMPADGTATAEGVGIRLLDVSTNQFVKVKPIGGPFQVPLPSAKNGTTRMFRAYVGGLGDKDKPATCKSDGTNVLCGGTANVQIHFEFSYERLK